MTTSHSARMFHLLLIIILLRIQTSHGDVFTSVVDLQNILHAEQDLAQVIDNYIQAERVRLEKLEHIAQDFHEHSRSALADPDRKLGNLVSSFKTVKRFTLDWKRIQKSYIYNFNQSQFHIKQMGEVTSKFPSRNDLRTAVANLLRIQDTYALDPVTMAQGRVTGMSPGEELDAQDCFELGRIAYEEDDHYHAIPWMEHALVLIDEEGGSSPLDKCTVYEYLNFAHYKQNNLHRAKELAEAWIAIDPNNELARRNLNSYRDMITLLGDDDDADGSEKSKPILTRRKNEWQSTETFANYEALCRGEELDLNKDVRHTLYCSYKSYHPLFVLTPLKEEILSFDPPIKVFHDVLTETETDLIKTLATPKLQRSKIISPKGGEEEFTSYRISKQAWIGDRDHPTVRLVSERSGALANLTLETVEPLQVVNYGIGGHYEPHYDFAEKGKKANFQQGAGNRIATVLYYVADVDAGGSTVFPDVGVAVRPERGAAAVWYNLHRSGERDYRTRHAGCPVLTGSKWIATKWFHETGNERSRPCLLHQDL